MATLGGSVPMLPDDAKRMDQRKVVTAFEVEKSVKDNLGGFRKHWKVLTRGAAGWRVARDLWWRFGWMVEDLFRHLLGLGEADKFKRFSFLMTKVVYPKIIPVVFAAVTAPNRPWFSLKDYPSQASSP